jgi:Rieske Fe-S protein
MDHHHAHHPDRRNFLTKAASVVLGTLITVVPGVAGLLVFLDPARRKSPAAEPIKVGSLSAIPENGEPKKFDVVTTHVDIFNRTPNIRVGAVYLQRTGSEVKAFNAKCPHLGCFVNFKSSEHHYHCPCHNSTFAINGQILDPTTPSPRALDQLQVEVRGTDVYVRFQNFQPGIKEKVSV